MKILSIAIAIVDNYCLSPPTHDDCVSRCSKADRRRTYLKIISCDSFVSSFLAIVEMVQLVSLTNRTPKGRRLKVVFRQPVKVIFFPYCYLIASS